MRRESQADWRSLLTLYWVASFVEGYGVAQIYAFLPNRLAEIGLDKPDIEHFVGLLGSLFFLSGLPLIPFWGVWADKYSRKAIIVRSALVETAVFGLVAVSQQSWQLVLAMLLVAFQLGNSGVMMAAIRDVTPRHRLGLAMGVFASSFTLGSGAGPAVGALMIDQLHLGSGSVFGLSALLSVLVALVLAVGSREVRPEIVPVGSTVKLALGAVRGVLADATVRWLFAIYFLVFVGRQMSTQYMALLVHQVEGTPIEVAGAVGLVLGLATIVGGALSPIGGWIADRVGFRAVLVASIAGMAVSFAALPLSPAVGAMAVVYSMAIAFTATVGAMVSGLVATEIPAERRSATLNLIYLPLYLGGIVGPALGASVVSSGLPAVFYLAALILAAGAVMAVLFARLRGAAGKPNRAPIDGQPDAVD